MWTFWKVQFSKHIDLKGKLCRLELAGSKPGKELLFDIDLAELLLVAVADLVLDTFVVSHATWLELIFNKLMFMHGGRRFTLELDALVLDLVVVVVVVSHCSDWN